MKTNIEVETAIAQGGGQGCDTQEFTSYTLCLRPVKEYQYANNKNYTINQEETKTLIKQEVVRSYLQEVKERWTTTKPWNNQEDTKISDILTTINQNINVVKEEDLKPFPNFKRIKDERNIMTRQIKDLGLQQRQPVKRK